jgi:hypothetical protein
LKLKFPKRIIVLAVLLFSIAVLPLLVLFSLKGIIGQALASAPSDGGLKTISGMARAGLTLTRLYSTVLPQDVADFFRSAENKYLSNLLIFDLKNQISAATIQGLYGSGDTNMMLSAMELKANNLLKQLDTSGSDRKLIAFGRELLPLAKWAMGMDHKKTFLLVLQNSMEQRPTGGLVEGVGVAVFEKGRLLDVTWLKPEEVEASLTGSEDAPQPIRAMLGESKLLFRDANWALDGPGAALQMKKMYERATGRGIDGTVFFSTAGLEDMLETLGKESIKEKMAFSGPEYISQIAAGLGESLKNSPFLTIKGLLKGLQNENILIVPFEAEQARAASILGLDGGIKQLPCPAQLHSLKCLSNFIYVVDANLGANRADYFMKKSRRVSIVMNPSRPPVTVLDLSYFNTSTVDNSSSVYRGYTRVAIPLESIVQSAVMTENGQAVQIPIDNYVESGHHIVGLVVDVKPGESKVIRITYVSTTVIPIDRGTGGYILNLKKQSGDSVMTEVEVKLPEGITPLSVYPQPKVTGNSLNFMLPMVRSDSVVVEFAVNDLFR